MNIETIVNHLGHDIGLNLSFDDKACISLKFDSEHLLVIEAPEGDERIYIYSMIGLAAQEEKLDTYEHLLEANLFGKGTRQSWFACNRETGEIFLTSAIDKDALNYDRFLSTLEAFLERMNYWSKKFNEPAYPTALETPAQDADLNHEPAAGQLYNPFV